MTLRPIKLAVVLLLGFVLAWQGVLAASATTGAKAHFGKRSCCCAGCDDKHCAAPACCVKREAPSTPVAPASVPSAPQKEFRALAAAVLSLLPEPSRRANELPTYAPLSSLVTAIPLFQRDCCYLL